MTPKGCIGEPTMGNDILEKALTKASRLSVRGDKGTLINK